jgi:hypothetical protein
VLELRVRPLVLTVAPQAPRTFAHVFACVTSIAASLLFLSPVLVMVVLVLFAKLRQRGMEEQLDPLAEPPLDVTLERELEPMI